MSNDGHPGRKNREMGALCGFNSDLLETGFEEDEYPKRQRVHVLGKSSAQTAALSSFLTLDVSTGAVCKRCRIITFV